MNSSTESDVHNRKSHHELHHEAFHAEHGDDAEHDHDHDEFESFVVSASQMNDREALVNGLKEIIEQFDILRLKGFVALEGKPMRLVVQAVGNRVDHYFDREWETNETRHSQLVVIGLEGMEHSAIEAKINGLFG